MLLRVNDLAFPSLLKKQDEEKSVSCRESSTCFERGKMEWKNIFLESIFADY
jgi:hypothetical protein